MFEIIIKQMKIILTVHTHFFLSYLSSSTAYILIFDFFFFKNYFVYSSSLSIESGITSLRRHLENFPVFIS